MGKHPPEEVALAFADVDLILHAGDIYSSACLDWLEQDRAHPRGGGPAGAVRR